MKKQKKIKIRKIWCPYCGHEIDLRKLEENHSYFRKITEEILKRYEQKRKEKN